MMKVKVVLDIPDTRVEDLLTMHTMSMSDWLLELKGTFETGFRVRYDEKDDDVGDGNGRKTVGHVAILRGLALMAKEYPRHWADFMDGNDDDITCDVAWQCIIFKDVIYG